MQCDTIMSLIYIVFISQLSHHQLSVFPFIIEMTIWTIGNQVFPLLSCCIKDEILMCDVLPYDNLLIKKIWRSSVSFLLSFMMLTTGSCVAHKKTRHFVLDVLKIATRCLRVISNRRSSGSVINFSQCCLRSFSFRNCPRKLHVSALDYTYWWCNFSSSSS